MAGHRVPSWARTAVALLALASAACAASCKDEANKDVEWFFLYKLPKDASRFTTGFNKRSAAGQRGDEYFYVDERTPASTATWARSEHSIAEPGGALANTLAPLYTTNKSALNVGYVAYNDQPPSRITTTAVDSNGHTKATHLRVQHPHIYDGYGPPSLLAEHPQLALLLQKSFIHSPPWLLVDRIIATGNASFLSFAKNGHFDQDVYEAAVGATLRTDLLASSWRNGGGGRLPPACGGPNHVLDVLQMRISDANASHTFDNSEDHSKWAVSFNRPGEADYVCIGSLNRMHSQLERGGETLCFRNAMLHTLLFTSVVSHDTCPA
ncbi:plancitoxin-1-like isoform X2 [Haemaphysalis longicornis]